MLRAWEAADAPVVLEAARDPAIGLFAPMPEVADGGRAAARAWCEARADWSSGEQASWAVTEDGRVVGSISAFELDHDQSTGELGYFVLPAFRGRGIAGTALASVTSFCFERIGLWRLELFHAVENEASCAVASRAGFLHEGTHRQSFRYGDGVRHDEHLHGRLASDPPAEGAP
ncbi:MAG TPA: GNAT family protein [Acidimicrobiales bacterium]|nr:GNAT family protein [Acidimicrobiales bacterium]